MSTPAPVPVRFQCAAGHVANHGPHAPRTPYLAPCGQCGCTVRWTVVAEDQADPDSEWSRNVDAALALINRNRAAALAAWEAALAAANAAANAAEVPTFEPDNRLRFARYLYRTGRISEGLELYAPQVPHGTA
jgi:hypothetical protein